MTRDLGRLTRRISAKATQIFSGLVGSGASYSVCRPPWCKKRILDNIVNPHFVCGDMCNLNFPCKKYMIGAMSCNV